MRTKTLSANQRIRIGRREYPTGEELRVLAHVLQSVGLILEVEPDRSRNVGLVLYAARRVATNEIAMPSQARTPAPAAATEDHG